jgi:hypothetical protein
MTEPDDDFEGPCELEQHIRELTERNPDVPRLIEEARARREEARAEREQWVGYLPDSERELFIKDVAGLFEECAVEGDFYQLVVCIQQWKNTAEVHANRALKERLMMDPEDFVALQARLGELPRDNPRLKALLATEKPVPSEMELSDDFLALHRASEAGDDDVSEEFDFELLETHPVDEEDQPSS